MEIHEAAKIFPMAEESIPALAEDIKTNGQRLPILLLNGQVIDGRRRLAACELAGVTPTTADVTMEQVKDPIAFVLSLNDHRRHLTASQRALAAAKAKSYYERLAKERHREGSKKGGLMNGNQKVRESVPEPSEGKRARDEVGEKFNVCGRYVDMAEKVARECEPEVYQAVEKGKIPLTQAVKLAGKEPEEQKEAIEKTKDKPQEKPVENGLSDYHRQKAISIATDVVNLLKRLPPVPEAIRISFKIVSNYIRHNSRNLKNEQPSENV